MKNTLAKIALASTILTASTCATTALAGEVSANIGATSNYLWRGVTQSADKPSISGGIDYADDSGFYIGTWIGSVDWGTGGTENDYYLGFSGESGDFSYDVGYIYYNYPATGYEDSDFGEVYFNGGIGGFGFGVAYTANSQVAKGSQWDTGDIYYNVSYGFDLANEYSLSVLYGYYTFDAGSEYDYGHLQLDLAKGDFTLSISKADEESGSDDTKFVVSWGTSF